MNLLLPFRPTPLTIASDSSPDILWDTSLFSKGTQKCRVRSANVAVITNTSKFLVRLPEILWLETTSRRVSQLRGKKIEFRNLSDTFGLLFTAKERTMGSKLFYVKVFLRLDLRFWRNIAIYRYKSSKYRLEIFVTEFSLNIRDIFEINLTFTVFDSFPARFIFQVRIKHVVQRY